MVNLKSKKKTVVKNGILKAAKTIIEKDGFEHLSIRKIASSIGYSVGSIYQYYPSKDDLVIDLIQDHYQAIVLTLQSVEIDNDIEATIKEKFKAYCKFAYKHPSYYKMMMLSNNPIVLKYTSLINTSNTPALKLLIDLLDTLDIYEDYTILDTKDAARFLWTSVFGLLVKALIEDVNEVDFINLIDKQLTYLLNSLKGGR